MSLRGVPPTAILYQIVEGGPTKQSHPREEIASRAPKLILIIAPARKDELTSYEIYPQTIRQGPHGCDPGDQSQRPRESSG